MSDLTPTDITTSEIPIPNTIRATNMTYNPSSANERNHHSYENTEIAQNPTEKSESNKAQSDISQYSDVPAPLPGFLRNEEMLVAPTVSEDVITAAQLEESLCKVEVKSAMVTKPSLTSKISLPTDDYVDPQDAKNIMAAKCEHEKMAKKVSQGNSDGKPSPELIHNVSRNDREDYTEVSDALPQGAFAKIDPKAMLYSGDYRNRTTSDTSPMLSSRSAESGKASNPSPKIEKKSNSLRGDRSKHAKTTKVTTPVRRRSTLQQKELVCFDPNTAGFKLAAKRTNSDGTPVPTSENSDSQHNSPMSDPGQEFDKGFIQGGAHVYAAVDLTAKCRPDDDILRREGVGVPEHYKAPVPCN